MERHGEKVREKRKNKERVGDREVMKWVETWEGSRRTFLSQLWVGGGILTECLTNKTRHRLFQYSRQKPTGTSQRNEGEKRDFGRKKRQANERTSRLQGPVRQAWNRSSPAVNLSLPLPLLSPPKWRQKLAAAVAALGPWQHTHSSCTDRWWGCLINTGFDGGSQRGRGEESKAITDCKQQSWAAIIWLLLLGGYKTLDSTHNSLLMTHRFNWNAADYLNTIVPVEWLTTHGSLY